MELNKYLRIKTAYIGQPENVLDDPANASVKYMPNDSSPGRGTISPAAVQATVSNAADGPRAKELFKRNQNKLEILKESSPKYGGRHSRYMYQSRPDTILIQPGGSIITLLHEIGHGTYPYEDANGSSIYPYDTMNEKYIEEARANRFAFDRLNSITDKKLRDELSSLAYGNLKPYELTYKLQRTPEFISKTVARGVPALGLGAIGATLGNLGGTWLADKFRLDPNSWKARALKWGSTLGLGALAGYGGYRLGKHYARNKYYPFNSDKLMEDILTLPYYINKLDRIYKLRQKATDEYNKNRDRLESEFTDYQSKKDNYNYNIYNEKDPQAQLMSLIREGKLNYDDMTKALRSNGYRYGTERKPTYDEMAAAFSNNGTNLQ